MKNSIIASTSTLHGGQYLAYLETPLKKLFVQADEIVFIPYARPGGISLDHYTAIASKTLATWGKKTIGLHTFEDPIAAIAEAKAIFTGGGNTFVLVKTLQDQGLMKPLYKAIRSGTPYLGTSAGSNICGISMQTTNDMPIVYPDSYDTLSILPFNLNPHYLDPNPESKHNGETRETRIKEYHKFHATPVIGLREGSWIRVSGEEIYLRGGLPARIFEQGQQAYEIENGASLTHLSS